MIDSNIFRVTSEKNSSSEDAESDDHDSAQVLYGGCARAQPREAQVSLCSKYVCMCAPACMYEFDRQPRGCNGRRHDDMSSSLVDLARSMPP